jgi:hypothetical protein
MHYREIDAQRLRLRAMRDHLHGEEDFAKTCEILEDAATRVELNLVDFVWLTSTFGPATPWTDEVLDFAKRLRRDAAVLDSCVLTLKVCAGVGDEQLWPARFADRRVPRFANIESILEKLLDNCSSERV